MNLDSDGDNKWDLKPIYLPDLKENMSEWQVALQENGWNSLYWNNHDQPRIVSRFGNDNRFRVRSAKMLATCLHMMKGTPYIYQGEEIGMTNVHFETLDDYRDIETLNMYKERKEQGYSHESIMQSIYTKGRDNARTPYQWDNSENAGFTTGMPWLKVNPRYTEINNEEALKTQIPFSTTTKILLSYEKRLKSSQLVIIACYYLKTKRFSHMNATQKMKN